MTDNPASPEREQPPRWQIGQLATMAATTARAIRLYEAAGLMPGPARSAVGYRLYGPADLATLIRIRRLRSLGFQLEQIRALLSPEDTPLMVRLRERLAALDQDPRWAALQQRLGQLRDVHGPPAGEVEQLARELAGVLPRELVPDDLADAVLPTVLLGARFSPAQLAVIHRAAQIQRAAARRTDA